MPKTMCDKSVAVERVLAKAPPSAGSLKAADGCNGANLPASIGPCADALKAPLHVLESLLQEESLQWTERQQGWPLTTMRRV